MQTQRKALLNAADHIRGCFTCWTRVGHNMTSPDGVDDVAVAVRGARWLCPDGRRLVMEYCAAVKAAAPMRS